MGIYTGCYQLDLGVKHRQPSSETAAVAAFLSPLVSPLMLWLCPLHSCFYSGCQAVGHWAPCNWGSLKWEQQERMERPTACETSASHELTTHKQIYCRPPSPCKGPPHFVGVSLQFCTRVITVQRYGANMAQIRSAELQVRHWNAKGLGEHCGKCLFSQMHTTAALFRSGFFARALWVTHEKAPFLNTGGEHCRTSMTLHQPPWATGSLIKSASETSLQLGRSIFDHFSVP